MYAAAQFNPTQQTIARIVDCYGMRLKGFRLATSGIENCTILCVTDQGEYVVRVYRHNKKSNAEIDREINFTRYLRQNNLPIATALPNNSGEYMTLVELDDTAWQVIVMQREPGDHAEGYTTPYMAQLAKIQATMHLLAANYPDSTAKSELRTLAESSFIQMIQNRSQLDPQRQSFVNRVENYQVELPSTLPTGLCHLDFDNGNVLCEGNNVIAVLDFDDLSVAPYVLCLAYTAWDILYDNGLPGAAEYIKLYETTRQLTTSEDQLLAKIMLFRHYVIGCKDIADNQMNDAQLSKYLELETILLNPDNMLFWR